MSGFPITDPRMLTQQRQKLLSQLSAQYGSMMGGAQGSSAWAQGAGSPFSRGLPHVAGLNSANLYSGAMQGLGAAVPRGQDAAPDYSGLFRGASVNSPAQSVQAPDMLRAISAAGNPPTLSPGGSFGGPYGGPGAVNQPASGAPYSGGGGGGVGGVGAIGNMLTGANQAAVGGAGNPGAGVAAVGSLLTGANAAASGLVPLGNGVYYDPSTHQLSGNTGSLGGNAGGAARGVGIGRGAVL